MKVQTQKTENGAEMLSMNNAERNLLKPQSLRTNPLASPYVEKGRGKALEEMTAKESRHMWLQGSTIPAQSPSTN